MTLDAKIEASSQIIYPMLIASYRRGEIREVVDSAAISKYSEMVRTINNMRSSSHSRLDIEIL